jgi:hypothetical protein
MAAYFNSHGQDKMNAPATLHPFEGLDFNWLLDSRAQAHPDKRFLTWEPFEGPGGTPPQPRHFTYAEFREQVLAAASSCSPGAAAHASVPSPSPPTRAARPTS